MRKTLLHRYLKYLFLLLLAFKVFSFVEQNFHFCSNEETSELVELKDLNSDSDKDKEVEADNIKLINSITNQIYVNAEIKSSTTHSEVIEYYKNLYLKFSTPPPRFV